MRPPVYNPIGYRAVPEPGKWMYGYTREHVTNRAATLALL